MFAVVLCITQHIYCFNTLALRSVADKFGCIHLTHTILIDFFIYIQVLVIMKSFTKLVLLFDA